MSDLIERQAAIAKIQALEVMAVSEIDRVYNQALHNAIAVVKGMPSAQPEVKPIEYRDCANAMLWMWMDNVVTDGEYNRIMDKLKAHWGMKNG